ncbi:MAG: hypothetical protein H7Y33_00850 [Cytophagales bacterium]|nr:hypothetical protein [Rhizobacter sp.]
MGRYVLRYAGNQPRHGSESGVDTAEVVLRAGAKVIDDAPDMLLVEANAGVARTLAHLLPEWQINAEAMTPVPRVPRPAVRTAARGRRR